MKLFSFELRRATIIGQALIPTSTFDGLAGATDWRKALVRQSEIIPWASLLLLRLGVLLVWCAPLVMGYFRFFGGLKEAAKVECLERLLKARSFLLRQIMTFLKLTFCACVIGNERVLQHLRAYDYGQPIRLTVGSRS